jgi:mRNA interferase HigB
MRIVSLSTIVAYYSQPDKGDSKGALEAWYDAAKLAKWTAPADVKAQYRNASIVGNNRVVFNIAGNKYRLVVAIAYQQQFVYVKFIGTHPEYDAIDAATVDQSR